MGMRDWGANCVDHVWVPPGSVTCRGILTQGFLDDPTTSSATVLGEMDAFWVHIGKRNLGIME